MKTYTSSPVLEAVQATRLRLEGFVATPTPEAEQLVKHVSGLNRTELYTGQTFLEEEARRMLDELVQRRRRGEPLQYLLGVQQFRSLELEVGPGVLVPRPETEITVEVALSILEVTGTEAGPKVLEVGCGAGPIALSIASERGDAEVWATEVSAEALAWARRNRDRHRLWGVRLMEGDLFAPLPRELEQSFDLVVSNPPYLTPDELDEAADDVRLWEPRSATVSGPTGIEVMDRIAAEAEAWLRPGGALVLEITPDRVGEVESLLRRRYLDVAVIPDLTGRPRVARARRK